MSNKTFENDGAKFRESVCSAVNYYRRYAMSESLQENNHPENQLAKSALKKLGKSPDPDLIYSIQLMLLATNREHYPLPMANLQDQIEVLEDLLYQEKPSVAMDYLTTSDIKEPVPLPDNLGPWDLAKAMLLRLHSKMAATLDSYPVQVQRVP